MHNSYTLQRLIVLLIGMSVLLSGCGFHLRGSQDFSAQINSLFIEGTPAQSDLGRELRQAFSAAKVNVLEDKFGADLTLVIRQDQKAKRVISLDSSGQPNQYELSYQVQFLLLNKEAEERLPLQTVRLQREYIFDPSLILAKSSEEQRLQKDMLRQVVDQILRRVAFGLQKPALVNPAENKPSDIKNTEIKPSTP